MSSMWMDLSLHSVQDRGKPNLERVVLQANAPCRLNEYGITLGLSMGDRPAPYVDKCFWFADPVEIAKGDWVFVYTGPGTRRIDTLSPPFTGRLHNYFWGRTETSFFHPSITPILFRILDVEHLPAPALMLPQPQGMVPAILDQTAQGKE